MGDRPESHSRVCMSEDKVRRKDLCGSMRAVYVLEKLSDVSGPSLVEARRYRTLFGCLQLFCSVSNYPSHMVISRI
jgi:hypothetical protein